MPVILQIALPSLASGMWLCLCGVPSSLRTMCPLMDVKKVVLFMSLTHGATPVTTGTGAHIMVGSWRSPAPDVGKAASDFRAETAKVKLTLKLGDTALLL